MLFRLRSFPILLVLVASACAPPRTDPAVPANPPGDSLRAVILAEVDAYYRDFSARDWEAFAAHFWPGAHLTTIWQPPGESSERVWTVSVPDFVAQAPAGPGSREIFEERRTDATVVAGDRMAQVWARYEARFGDPGEIMEWEGVDAFTLIKHEGAWRIVSLAYVAE